MSQRPKVVRHGTSDVEIPTTLTKKQFQQVKNLTKDDGHFNLVRGRDKKAAVREFILTKFELK
ncbi:hypothetical protein BGZ76_009064 [Entomortierella beljakovae]|nr:hypothetical protein BGZ76_009064 [Entomortierella beljakovae]